MVRSTTAINNNAVPALGLAYLSGYLRHHGIETRIVDAIGEGLDSFWPIPARSGLVGHGLTFDDILDRIPADSDVIAFSAMFSGEWFVLRDLISCAKARFPTALTVAGGEHATALPEYCLRDCPALDVVVRGEGERALLALLQARAISKGDAKTSAGGASCLDADGRYHENPRLLRIDDLASLPWPHWPDGYLERFWRAGHCYGVSSGRDVPFLTSRGCPYRCTFCTSPKMWTRQYRVRPVDDCLAEITSHVERYDITGLALYDLAAAIDKPWLTEFCQKLIGTGFNLSWTLPTGTRSEAFDKRTLRLMKQSGCRYIGFAPESGSPETLVKIRKRVQLTRLMACAREAQRYGMGVRMNLIIGFPHESRKHVFETLRFGLRAAMLGIDDVPVLLYAAYPGTEIFDELVAADALSLDDDYLLSMTSLNGSLIPRGAVSYASELGVKELIAYRVAATLLNYAVSYVVRPRRLVRFMRNLGKDTSASAIEQKVKGALRLDLKHLFARASRLASRSA